MIEINEINFEERIKKSTKSILYIKASWCGPCKQLSPIVEELSIDLSPNVMIGKMDADENMDFVKSLGVRNIPTLLFFKDGEIIERSTGLKTKMEISKIIESI